ncbi:MAG TPA: hypothetical protein VIH93_02200 [Thermoanaerobaculia bacterium]|jgi:hypothetical protein
MSEPVEPTSAPAPPPAARPPAAIPPAAPARPLPSQEDIADWIDGADVPLIGAPFEGLTMARFDALVMQVRKEEAIPQHWQAISDRAVPDDLAFERLPEVGGLRVRYKDQELSRRRLAPLRLAWRELAGRRPAMWSVSDLFAAMRRLYEHNAKVDWTDLLTAIRDVWRDLELPHGREQLEVLWTCLAIVRKNTKK